MSPKKRYGRKAQHPGDESKVRDRLVGTIIEMPTIEGFSTDQVSFAHIENFGGHQLRKSSPTGVWNDERFRSVGPTAIAPTLPRVSPLLGSGGDRDIEQQTS